jgi:hypothetical protein
MIDTKYFKELILSYRPNLSNGTIRTYLSSINSMAKNAKVKLDTEKDVLKYIDELYNTFKESSPIVKKSKLATLITLLDDKTQSHSKELEACLNKLRKEMFLLADKQKEKVQELTPSQQENIIPWDEVLSIYKNLEKKAKPLLMTREKLNHKELEQLQKYILLSLYVETPPRRSLDYTDFKIKNIDTKNDNYLKIVKGKPYLVFNKYKNASRLGPQEVQINNKLKLLIQKWSFINPYDYLIVANNGNAVTSSRITNMLNDIFGKQISSSMLRHIFMSHKFGNVDLKAIQDTTHDMGSSNIAGMLNYVNKEK